jgi:hypothetical protein
MPSDPAESRPLRDAVSKAQVLRFVEQRFLLADHDRDGMLNQNEFALLAYSIACSFQRAKAIRYGLFSDAVLNDHSLL